VRGPARILIVDDQPIESWIFFRRALPCMAMTPHATDGAEASAVASTNTPTICRHYMPRSTGIEVCQRLKADTPCPSCPFIMVTARGALQDMLGGGPGEAGAMNTGH